MAVPRPGPTPPGVDPALLERAQHMTPTERLDAVVELLELGQELAEALRAKQLET